MGRGQKQKQKTILPRPLVWQRMQMPSQQATMGLAPMEGVERTNTVVVRGVGQGQRQSMGVPSRQDPYAIEMD